MNSCKLASDTCMSQCEHLFQSKIIRLYTGVIQEKPSWTLTLMVFETLIRQFDINNVKDVTGYNIKGQRSASSVKISWINNKRSLELSPSLKESDLTDVGKKERIKNIKIYKDLCTQVLVQSLEGDWFWEKERLNNINIYKDLCTSVGAVCVGWGDTLITW